MNGRWAATALTPLTSACLAWLRLSAVAVALRWPAVETWTTLSPAGGVSAKSDAGTAP